jgi:hypothetical protein
MTPSRSTGRATTLVAVLLLAGSCAAPPKPDPADASSSTGSATPPAAAEPRPSLEGPFTLSDGRALAVTCWGTGEPAVLFDAGTGDPGIARWTGSPITNALAADRTVCAYDRAGLGASDPPPPQPRTLDEVVDEYHYAGRYPDEVAGLVLLDVPAGNPDMPADEVPAWDSPENPEHVDYVAVERQMAVSRLPIPAIPVTVVTASSGQSADPTEQRVWLDGSSNPTQTVLEGGHDIQYADPDGVLAAIQDVLETVDLS